MIASNRLGRLLGCTLILLTGNLILSVSSSWAQSRIFRWYEHNEFDRLEALLEDDQFLHRNGDDAVFLRTVFEKDGNEAVERFKGLIRSGSRSVDLPALIERVALHQYASGLYNTARSTFLYIADNYSRTPFGERGLYYAARCWQAIGRADSTRMVTDRLRRRYSRSPYIAMLDIDLSSKERSRIDNSLAEKESGLAEIYSVQAGAFSTDANARIQQQLMDDKGFQAEIYVKLVENREYYVVCVGRFATKLEAERRGEEIRRHFRIDFRVVDLNELEKAR